MSLQFNLQQQVAINAIYGPILVSAGAGSGKTLVLTERVRQIIVNQGASPHEILLVTFTNKATKELESRLHDINTGVGGMWIGTFHALCLRMLRENMPTIPRVIDPFGQKNILKTIKIPCFFQPHDVLDAIEVCKNTGKAISSPELRNVYNQYERIKSEQGLVDYTDLLIKANEILEDSKIAELYQERFRFVCVDEYQDTNVLQDIWLRKISNKHQNIFCVGDEDQSIFGWRGADPELMSMFKQRFSNAEVFKLEDNYRSTSNILSVANCLIRYNKRRIPKVLKATQEKDGSVGIYECSDEAQEAAFIVRKLQELPGTSAILCRTVNGLRAFEDELRDSGVGFSVLGGASFYNRPEVKDVVAFASFLVDQNMDSFKRIANLPKRGVGERLIDAICADERGIESAGRGESKLSEFFLDYDIARAEKNPGKQLEIFLTRTGYMAMREADPSQEKNARLENVRNILADIEESGSLDEFCRRISKKAHHNVSARIFCMTLHTSKGLEFDNVALPCWAEGIMPHAVSLGEGKVEEERRLAYVGITRAKKNLLLTYSKYVRGGKKAVPSRFLSEVPLSVPWKAI